MAEHFGSVREVGVTRYLICGLAIAPSSINRVGRNSFYRSKIGKVLSDSAGGILYFDGSIWRHALDNKFATPAAVYALGVDANGDFWTLGIMGGDSMSYHYRHLPPANEPVPDDSSATRSARSTV